MERRSARSEEAPNEPVLVLNAGSSSLKAAVLPHGPRALVERIGAPEGARLRSDGAPARRVAAADVAGALDAVLTAWGAEATLARIGCVGHRVVHGAERFVAPTVLDDAAVAALRDATELAPLHLPGNLAGIAAARARFPELPHVAVFDTAFHARLPRRAYLYPLPMRLYREHRIRRYGFHGTSHDVVSERAARRIGRERSELRIVTLHLGNGASAAAVDRGRSVDTTMGFTPMEGLMMGTRSGDVDPGIVLHLAREGATPEAIDALLNRESGLLGLSGVSNDVRDVRAAADAGNVDAAAALEVYAYRVAQAVARMTVAMNGVDLIVFTGGVGENDAALRADAAAHLAFLGVRLDPERNRAHGPDLSAAEATVACVVEPTDEEGRIAELARAASGGGARS